MKKAILILLNIYSLSVSSQETKSINNQDLIWYAYYNTLQFSEKTFLVSELQERHFINPIAQHQIVVRTHLHRKISENWETSAGFCFFFHDKNDPEQTQLAVVPEFRPHLEFENKQQINKITLSHRYRAEFRYFHNTTPDRMELEDGYTFRNFRLRYQLQAIMKLFSINKRAVKLRVMDEIMLNAGKKIVNNVFDNNNIYAGLQFEITPNIAFELGFLKRFQQENTAGSYLERDIIRLTLFHKINL